MLRQFTIFCDCRTVIKILVLLFNIFIINEGLNIAEQLLAEGVRLPIKDANLDSQIMIQQKLGNRLNREL